MDLRTKKDLNDLSLFGGSALFEEPLHVGRPNTADHKRFLSCAADILRRRQLSNNGVYLREFEQQVAAILGVKHVVAVCNGTAGLLLAIRALGLSGQVIVPSFTFVATVHALQWMGVEPVFCDIDPQTHNIDPKCVEKLVTSHTSGILGVHVWGRPCAIADISGVALRHGIKLIFDASHAFGCSSGGISIGNFGDAEVFSFHATKFVNTFEGGAVVTNSDVVAEDLRLLRNFGFKGQDRVIALGINAKMSEMCAAMGLVQLDAMAQFVDRNRQNYERYRAVLGSIDGLSVIEYRNEERNNFQYIVVEVESEIGFTRDELARILRSENILVRRYFYPGCHEMEPYRSLHHREEWGLPHTEALTKRVLCFPTGTVVGESDIDKIGALIKFCADNAHMIKSELPSSCAAL